MCPCSKGQKAALGRVLPVDQGGDPSHLSSTGEATSGVLCPVSSSGLSSTRETRTNQIKSRAKVPWRWWRDWKISHMNRRRERWNHSVWRRQDPGVSSQCVWIPDVGVLKSQTVSDTQWPNNRQCAESQIQEVLFKHKKKVIFCENCWTL